MTNAVPAKKFSALKKVALALVIMAALYIGFLIALALLVNAEQMSSVAAISESSWLIVMRFTIYVLLWVFWRPILRHFKPTITDAAIKGSRRPLAVLILAYEFLFASEIPQLLINW